MFSHTQEEGMKLNHTTDIYNIIKNFCIDGSISSIVNYGSGHINDTFYLKNESSEYPDYLLQKINNHVFNDVSSLTNNIYFVTSHLKNKIKNNFREGDPDEEVLSLVPTHNEMLYHQDNYGNYWRIYIFLKESKSYDIVTTEQQATEAGKAFGRFQFLLSDMNPKLLSETIVDFHNIKSRLRNFKYAIKNNSFDRLKDIVEEVSFIESREDIMSEISNWGDFGLLPIRIIHNDTKFNNILFDANDNAICVIDLDTVMPGFVAYDFGDAIRTIINKGAEDETDFSKIQLNIPLFKAYTKGYIKEAKDFLTSQEVSSLIHGVLLLPYMQSVRFLTDFLEGDHYFKTNYSNHNLDRAMAQLHLVKLLEANREDLENIILSSFYSKNIIPRP